MTAIPETMQQPPLPTPAETHEPATGDPSVPFWLPDGETLQALPAGSPQALAEIVQPVYRQHVLQAGDSLNKALGLTLVHMLWLEILEQLERKRQFTEVDARLGLPADNRDAITRDIRVLDAKVRLGRFLLRQEEYRNRRTEPARPAPRRDGSVIRPGQPIPPRMSRP
ncbi:MAG: hypothetical protein ACYC35_24830 [Pirellulales bacterium]